MKPWIIERIERDRQQNEWKPVPLRIQQPPPEWIEEQRRSEREVPSNRGVTIIGGDTPNERGVFIIDL